MFVVCGTGLELLLIQELEEIGIPARKGFRGVYVAQTIENVYKINYLSRIATRVLWPLADFSCRDRHELYARAKKIDWSLYLNVNKTFAIDANVTHPNLKNSLFAALVIKDTICDQFRDKFGSRPNVDISNPDVQLNLFINNGRATITLDTSGTPLYKRGYREESVAAPIQESIAAAILRIAGYSKEDVLFDPFCGSGTFLVEAAMIATKTPAGYFRKAWGFVNLPEFSEEAWLKVKENADKAIEPLTPGKIFGSDIDSKAVGISRSHLKRAGFAIHVVKQEVKNATPPAPPTLVVANPPYGKRLISSEGPYRDLGLFLKTVKARAAILSPDPSLIRLLGRHISSKTALSNGGLDVMLYLS